MQGTSTLGRPVSGGIGKTAGLPPAARSAAARPAADAGRPRVQARTVWFTVTAAVNSGLVVWSVTCGEVGSRAVEWSLAAFFIAVAARHDGIVRGAFVLGRLIRSYRLHQLTYHLGQLHRAMAAGVLAILVVMARTARDRVRQSRPAASSGCTGSAAGRRSGSSQSLFPCRPPGRCRQAHPRPRCSALCRCCS